MLRAEVAPASVRSPGPLPSVQATLTRGRSQALSTLPAVAARHARHADRSEQARGWNARIPARRRRYHERTLFAHPTGSRPTYPSRPTLPDVATAPFAILANQQQRSGRAVLRAPAPPHVHDFSVDALRVRQPSYERCGCGTATIPGRLLLGSRSQRCASEYVHFAPCGHCRDRIPVVHLPRVHDIVYILLARHRLGGGTGTNASGTLTPASRCL